MKSFENKVAAITGAGSGIGRALAVELGRQGCHLALADVNAAALEETRQLLASSGVRVSTAVVDVADREQVQAWADKAASEHGRVNLIFQQRGRRPRRYRGRQRLLGIRVDHEHQLLGRGERHQGVPSAPEGLRQRPRGQCLQRLRAVRPARHERLQRHQVRGARLHRVVAPGTGHGGLRRLRQLRASRRDQDQHRQDRANERGMAKVTGQAPDKAREQFNDQLLRTTRRRPPRSSCAACSATAGAS